MFDCALNAVKMPETFFSKFAQSAASQELNPCAFLLTANQLFLSVSTQQMYNYIVPETQNLINVNFVDQLILYDKLS